MDVYYTDAQRWSGVDENGAERGFTCKMRWEMWPTGKHETNSEGCRVEDWGIE